jgi:hypothetical protein
MPATSKRGVDVSTLRLHLQSLNCLVQ